MGYLAREAALSHLLRQVFPKVYGLPGKSTILKMPTVEQADKFGEDYYKANGIKRFANMSKDEIDLK